VTRCTIHVFDDELLENCVLNAVPDTARRIMRSTVDPADGQRPPRGVNQSAHVPPGSGHVAVAVNAGEATDVTVGLKSVEKPTFMAPVAHIFVSRNSLRAGMS
jgi:hypothetical protein